MPCRARDSCARRCADAAESGVGDVHAVCDIQIVESRTAVDRRVVTATPRPPLALGDR